MNNDVSTKKVIFIEGVNQFSPSNNKYIIYVGPYLFMMVIGMPLLIIGLIGMIVNILFGAEPNTFEQLITIMGGIFFARMLPYYLKNEINSYSTTKVISEGLIVRVFTFHYDWKFVPWEDVLGIVPSPLVLHDGVLNWVIKINALADTHTAIGKKYGDGTSPAIYLNSHIQNRDRLIDIIQENIDDYKSVISVPDKNFID